MMLKNSSTREVEALCEPVVILPSQFVDRRGLHAPEASLMSAVLEDAFLCVRRNVGARDRRRRRELHDASDWFFSQRRDWPFAFLPVCDTLGLDVTAVRQRVAALVAEHRAAETMVLPSVAPPIVQHMGRTNPSKGHSAIARSADIMRFVSSAGKPESAVGDS